MELTTLFKRQKELDEYIEQKHDLKSRDLFDEKILALFVEISELANETRCFKFWSLKEPSPKQVILEEYVDGIHFLLSLGLSRNLTPEKAEPFEQEITTTALFNQMYRAIDYFKDQQDEQTFLIVFELYLKLARQLGFTDNDILNAYHDKNNVNFKRQDDNY